MKPVDQTRFGAPDGNCFAACVASLLEIPLDEAPNLMHLDAWYEAFEAWLRPRGLYPIGFSCENEPPGWVVAGLHILSGGSPRGDFDHSVVARGKKIVHDPHPSRDGLRTRKDRIVLVPLDPASLRAPRSSPQLALRLRDEPMVVEDHCGGCGNCVCPRATDLAPRIGSEPPPAREPGDAAGQREDGWGR